MTLTWGEFLDLAAFVQNLFELIICSNKKEIDIKELDRRLSEAAQKYLDFFKDPNSIDFTESIRTV